MPIPATPRNAAHLLRRAAWGGLPHEIDQVVADGIEASVAKLLDTSAAPTPVEPAYGPGYIPFPGELVNLWFYKLASTSPTPALERLMWFWHGHFACDYHKSEATDLLLRQLITLRRNALGRFDDLLLAVTHDPAMNIYLDLHTSVVGQPNENYARELMELFSMGSGQGYTQADVVEVGRAFTGYDLVEDRVSGRPLGTTVRPGMHDFGQKTIFGQRGAFDAADVIALIVQKPECHRFIASRMWHRYAGTSPSPHVIDDLAGVFASRLEVRDLLGAMLTHPAFYADEVHDGLVSAPVPTLVRTARAFEFTFADELRAWEDDDDGHDPETGSGWMLPEFGFRMGQAVGEPPNVGGWPHNDAWLDARRATGRLQVARDLGWWVVEHEGPVVEALLAATRQPDQFISVLYGRFGVVEWSEVSAEQIRTAITSTDDDIAAVAAGIAATFLTPEVTLA